MFFDALRNSWFHRSFNSADANRKCFAGPGGWGGRTLRGLCRDTCHPATCFSRSSLVPIDARPSVPALGFALLLSLATGIVFGIAPAWMASQSSPGDALRGAGRSMGDRSSILQKPLVIAQVAFSIVLLIGAGLVTQSLRNLEHQDFGFVTESRLIVNIDPSLAGYTPDKLYGLYQRLEDTLPKNTRRPEGQPIRL